MSWVMLVDEVRPKPSCDHLITTTPRPMRAKLRTTWNATWGSSEHACTQMSPPLIAGSMTSLRNVGRSVSSSSGRSALQARTSSKNDRAEADGDRQVGRRQVERLAGVDRRALGVGLGRADRQARPESGAAAAAQVPSIALRPLDVGGVVTSNAAKARRSWAGRGDARPDGRRRTARRRSDGGLAGRRPMRRRRRSAAWPHCRAPPTSGRRRTSRRGEPARHAWPPGARPADVGGHRSRDVP